MIRTMLGFVAGCALFLSIGAAQATPCAVTNNFVSGTTASAADVNQNFTDLVNCINSLPPPTAAGTSSSPRQTVSAGPVLPSGTTAGLPNFLPAISGTLSIALQNVSGAVPLAVTAANNVDTTTGAQKDLVGINTTGLTWSGLNANTTNYLYVTVATNGTLTAGSTLLAPVYQWGGTPGTANGQFTFNIGEMKGYLGNGTTAPQAYVVFVGEALTGPTGVTSTVAYAYNGKYESAYTTTLPAVATFTSVSHNIGTVPRVADFLMECIATDRGYAVGDTINALSIALYDGANVGHAVIATTPKTIGIQAGASQAFTAVVKSTGVVAGAYTAANWKYKFVAQRGW